MNYIVVGADQGMVTAQVNKIIKDIKKNNTVAEYRFDWMESTSTEILTCLSSGNLFSEHTIAVVDNFDYLITNKSLSKINSDYKSLAEYIKNPNPISTLILVNVGSIKLLKNKQITTLLSTMQKFVLEPWTTKTFQKWMKMYCQKHNQIIESAAIDLILERLPHNMIVIKNEMNKLLMLQKPITKNMVVDITPVYFESNVFELSNDLMEKNASAFLKKYNYLVEQGFEWGQLLGALSSNLAQIRNLKVAANKNMSKRQAAQKLQIHEFRVQKLWCYVNRWSFDTIQKQIVILAELDDNFKNNKIYDRIITNWYVLKLLFKG